jgi:EAL domain-containing protein (putative c-di-GMP-specific phosphodiesterase class I)
MNDIEPGTPFLEYYPKEGGPLRKAALSPLPFTIGRVESNNLRIDTTQVSREHCRIVKQHGELWVRDLGSTNGTFVNGQRIQETKLEHGDILHVANIEFNVNLGQAPTVSASVTQVMNQDEKRSSQSSSRAAVVRTVRRFQEMLLHLGVRVYFQPIVDIQSEEPIGYAALREGDHAPAGLLVAERPFVTGETRLADRLNQLFRRAAGAEARRLPPGNLFVRLQPSEFGHDSLIESLCGLGGSLGAEQKLVVEIAEAAVSDIPYVSRFRERLAEARIGVAYTGFSAGKSRLAELAKTPPDFLAFDPALVRGIKNASPRQKQAAEVLAYCGERQIQVVATGADVEDDVRTCQQLGCKLAQGRYFGDPEPLSTMLAQVQRLVRVS